jgi:uncharacterized protein (DUF2141 family)
LVPFIPSPQFSNSGGIVIGDFNGDGKPDLAIGNNLETNNGTVDVYLGNGNGGFNTSPITTDGLPTFCCGQVVLQVADLNGDGKADILFSYDNGDGNDPFYGFVLLGKGDGTFSQPGGFFYTYISVAVGDINGDGVPDFVTSGWTSEDDYQATMIYLGDGAGNFNPSQSLGNVGGAGAALGDFNGDGKLDLALAGTPFDGNTGGIWVALGNGDGTFQTPIRYATGNTSLAVFAADLNGDGKLDLITDGICIYLGNGDGTFAPASCISTDLSGNPMALADFNGDGKLDVALLSYPQQTLYIYPGKGDGTFGNPFTYPISASNPFGMATGDFNNDGRLDFVTSLQSGTAVFLQPAPSASPGSNK